MASFNPMLLALQKVREEVRSKKQPKIKISSTPAQAPKLPSPPASPPATNRPPPPLLERIFHVDVATGLDCQLRILQDPNGVSQYGHGATVWDSALLLGKYMSKYEGRGAIQPGVKVLELGAGCGLSGLVASCLGADVTLTDLPNVLPLTQLNIHKNKDVLRTAIVFSKLNHDDVHRPNDVVAKALDWTKAEPMWEDEKFDVILGADLMYDTHLAQSLADTIARLLTSPSSIVIISHEHRKEHVDDEFTQAFLTRGFELCEVPREGRWDDDLSIYKLSRLERGSDGTTSSR
jgi:predicted nicotinamide N-methyase